MIPGDDAGSWGQISSVIHLAGACASVTVGIALLRLRQWERFGPASNAILASLVITALWCFAVAVDGSFSITGHVALAFRNLAYLFALYRLFASDGRHTSVSPVRPVLITLAFVAMLLPVAVLIESRIDPALPQAMIVYHLNVMLAMLEVVGGLVLVHNLYIGASQPMRLVLRWPALALGLVWMFELNLYTVAYLGSRWPAQLASLHGLVDIAFAGLLALGAARGREEMRLRPSRAVTFHSFSLLIIGAYFIAMVAVAQWLAYAGGNYSRWLQFGFIITATVSAAITLPSKRMRGWLRVTLIKNLFQHRYDYRAEWLRFTRTIGCQSELSPPLHQRAIQALADITDSPAGLLLTPDDQGDLTLAARWQWQMVEVPAQALPLSAINFLERHEFIIDLDDRRARPDQADEGVILPDWLRHEPNAWAVVPLLHYERLVGAVVLARPPQARKLDWEDFDLLRVVGQQLASYLAEHSGQQALIEAGQFDDFHRRIAFVMHDIKNLASQFGLLARNAERHAENPAFRADMLVTLRSSADKLNTLVARLSRYGGSSVDKVEPVELGPIIREISRQYRDRHQVNFIERDACVVTGNRDSIEQVLLHLVQNSVDASSNDLPVFVSVSSDGLYSRIEIVDSGHGMSPEFVRSRLFRPFDSSKPGGFGIGAYEARELVRAMSGRMEVESREGLGTRFVIRLPLACASNILKTMHEPGQIVA